MHHPESLTGRSVDSSQDTEICNSHPQHKMPALVGLKKEVAATFRTGEEPALRTSQSTDSRREMVMSAIHRTLARLFLLGVLAAFQGTASAQQPAAMPAAQPEAAFAAAKQVLQRGPADIQLRDQATLHLPAGYAFIPSKEAAGVLGAMGNPSHPEFLGMILSTAYTDANASFVLQYTKSDHAKDDDAKGWNVDELFRNLKADADPGHNYSTYVRGREGFISMNLVTVPQSVESQNPEVAQLLAALTHDDDKRSLDINSAKQHVGEFGLALLIGVALKKLAFFVAASFVKFLKVLVIGGIAALWGGIKASAREQKTAAEAVAPPAEPPGNTPQA
jgi:uncharacterized membrane-anchored protein